jgi:DNA-binding transcriptional MerR regulator
MEDLTEIKVSLAKIEATLDRNTDQLAEHMKRTDLLEQKVEVLKSEVVPLLPEIRKVLKYYPYITAVVLVVLSGKPELIQKVVEYFTKGAP